MEHLPEIIGLAGTNGVGKDTLANRRYKTQGAIAVSASDILRRAATEQGLDLERETLRTISTKWAHELGGGAMAIMIIEDYFKTQTDPRTGLTVVSVRRPAEATTIQEHGGAVIWLDADRDMRYQRIQNANRGRIDDLKPFDQWAAEEDEEMYPENPEPTDVNMSGVREIADFHIDNTFAGADRKTGTKKFHAYLQERFGI